MADLRFRILNVFTVPGDRLSGNPLCVFEDGRDLGDAQMQALARQFNLSETTFLLPPSSKAATARVRIFTPTFEMPFAGHPTLGTAHVVRALGRDREEAEPARVTLEMPAGLVEVTPSAENEWTLRTARAPVTRDPAATPLLAAMLGLPEATIAEPPLWIDTGSDQLVVPLASAEDVRNVRVDPKLLREHGASPKRGSSLVYVWAPIGGDEILARFFFLSDQSVIEDPATGSACANLGGYFIARKRTLPIELQIQQGESIGRPSLLHLRVDEERRVFVGGAVEELGRGAIRP